MQSTIFLITIGVALLAPPLDGANILFFTPFGSPSHTISFTPLIDEMDARGHNVTYLTMFKYKSFRNQSNVHDFHMTSVDDYLESRRINLFYFKGFNWTLITETMHVMTEGLCEALLTDENFRKVALDTSTKYDLVVIDNLMSECGLSIIGLLGNPPFIYYCTAAIYSWTAWALDVPEPFATVPFVMMPFDVTMNLQERITNIAAELMFLGMRYLYSVPTIDAVIQQHHPGVAPVLEIEQNVSLVLTNSQQAVINNVRPTAPFVIEIGATHCRPSRPLAKELEDFIRGAGEHGFVYFSLGSNLRSSDLPLEKITDLLNAFKRLNQRVIWKFELDELPIKLPSNVLIRKWLNQQDLLGHPKIRVFITHGGQLSIQESIYHGVPIIGIPIYSDQKSNIIVARRKGYGQYLDYDEITEDLVYSMITEALTNSSYLERSKYYSDLMRDTPMASLQTGAFWLEYMIRHKGSRHFRLVTSHVNFFQYLLLDIIAIVVLILFIIYFIAKIVIMFFLRKFLCYTKKYRSKGSSKHKYE